MVCGAPKRLIWPSVADEGCKVTIRTVFTDGQLKYGKYVAFHIQNSDLAICRVQMPQTLVM
jgi:hypothetical protein